MALPPGILYVHPYLLYIRSMPIREFVLSTINIFVCPQVSPVKNERDVVVLFLLTFRDITALKQPIEEDSKGGLSKFAKLARSVTRSRSALASQLSNQVSSKEAGKQSNLTLVRRLCVVYGTV